ncbi:hypothetical protein PISL3812_01935 [Talaromyces islandicus]|uniref:Uncharacterized protein n=1 Tax=Talaromyces islandicus TaxID=28573 RepID=A0A0U1LNF9_TALIS|nr:hypothetical protein PISL3812_01935 [Talaromyces islandicus]
MPPPPVRQESWETWKGTRDPPRVATEGLAQEPAQQLAQQLAQEPAQEPAQESTQARRSSQEEVPEPKDIEMENGLSSSPIPYSSPCPPSTLRAAAPINADYSA